MVIIFNWIVIRVTYKIKIAVYDNYKVKEKKIESSNVIKQNAVEHLKSHIKKPLLFTL